MAAQKFFAVIGGFMKQVTALVSSAGAADAGKIVATDVDGKLNISLLPTGIGANVLTAAASEALAAGKLVNLWNDAGTIKMRLADASNGRVAHGYVKESFASAATATAYRLNSLMAGQTSLTVGANYWLSTAGGVTATAIDATDDANAGKINQYIGVAASATEIATVEVGHQVL